MTKSHEDFMAFALREGRKGLTDGNKPVGAVIVLDDRVIGRGRNTVDTTSDPTNHAEIVAIRAACRTQKSASLAGATLYSIMEPCPMCLWAIHIAGIKRIVLGGRHAAMKRKDLGDYSMEKLLALTRQKIELITGILTEECQDMRWNWRKETGRI